MDVFLSSLQYIIGHDVLCAVLSTVNAVSTGLKDILLKCLRILLGADIAVERKGITDLFQSFASGRLYNQVEAMSKYYKSPCLLIEFSPEKSFSLQVIDNPE